MVGNSHGEFANVGLMLIVVFLSIFFIWAGQFPLNVVGYNLWNADMECLVSAPEVFLQLEGKDEALNMSSDSDPGVRD